MDAKSYVGAAVPRRASGYLFILMVASATGWPSVVRAQTDHDRAAARSAANAGADAFEQGHYDRSLELFSRAEQLVHAPPHLLFMARSLAKLGRVVEAREEYFKIVNEQLPATAPKAFKAAHEQAELEIGAADARIAYVTVTIRGGDATKVALSIDGRDVPAAEQGIPLPMDPGTHVFSAHVEQTRSDEKKVTLRDGAKESVELSLPGPPVKGVGTPSAKAASGSQVPASDLQPEAADGGGSGSTKRILAYAALGVGAVGVGVGTYFLFDSLKWRHRADQIYECNTTASCTANDKALVAHYDHESNVPRTRAIVAYAVGAVGIATGVVLLVRHDASAPANGTGLLGELRVAAGFKSLSVSGRF
jgi:hypothetical protein